MNAVLGVFLATLVGGSGPLAVLETPPPAPALAVADVVGAWSGTLTHDGETAPVFLEFEAVDEGKAGVKASVPAIHLAHVPIARAVPQIQGNEVRIGPFTFACDLSSRTLSGTSAADRQSWAGRRLEDSSASVATTTLATITGGALIRAPYAIQMDAAPAWTHRMVLGSLTK